MMTAKMKKCRHFLLVFMAIFFVAKVEAQSGKKQSDKIIVQEASFEGIRINGRAFHYNPNRESRFKRTDMVELNSAAVIKVNGYFFHDCCVEELGRKGMTITFSHLLDLGMHLKDKHTELKDIQKTVLKTKGSNNNSKAELYEYFGGFPSLINIDSIVKMSDSIKYDQDLNVLVESDSKGKYLTIENLDSINSWHVVAYVIDEQENIYRFDRIRIEPNNKNSFGDDLPPRAYEAFVFYNNKKPDLYWDCLDKQGIKCCRKIF